MTSNQNNRENFDFARPCTGEVNYEFFEEGQLKSFRCNPFPQSQIEKDLEITDICEEIKEKTKEKPEVKDSYFYRKYCRAD